MELRWIVVLSFLSCMTCAGTQRTYKRTCDCEYMVDGKCAYTLLIPSSNTCSQQGDGDGKVMPSAEALEQIEHLKVNVTDLRINSGDQAQMLSRLQNLLMTQQTTIGDLSRSISALGAATSPPQTQCQLCPELQVTLDNQMKEIGALKMEVDKALTSIQPLTEAISNLTSQPSIASTQLLAAIQINSLQLEALQQMVLELANRTMDGGSSWDMKNNSIVMEMMKVAGMMNETLIMQMMNLKNSSRMMIGEIDMMMNSSLIKVMEMMESFQMMNRSLRMEMMETFNMMNKSLMMNARDEWIRRQNNTKMKDCICEKKAFECEKRGLLVSGPHANVSDDMISASSTYNEFHAATRGRIFSKLENEYLGAWCAEEPNDPEEWLQFDLGKSRSLFGVVTRGRFDYDQWVTSYKVNYTDTDPSIATARWMTYNDILGETEIFMGNMDRNTAKVNMFWQPIRARYIRVIPVTSSDANKCMRADVIGCLDDQ